MKKNFTANMLRNIAMALIIVTVALGLNAQSVAINTSGNSPEASAILDVSSNSKGVLISRMTSVQRTAVATPAEGLLVYDTDTKGFWYYSQGVWNEVPKTSGGGFTLPYNGSYYGAGKLFSINNTSSLPGTSAIFGRSGNDSSGLMVNNTSSIWGDNGNPEGYGILGTSKSGFGIVGLSALDHGVYGSTDNQGGYAGVYGTSSDSNGVGVKGELYYGGTAVYGENWGSQGYAARFQLNNNNNSNTAVNILTYGTGRALYVSNANANSTSETGAISTNGLGRAFSASIINSANTAEAVRIHTQGLGDALNILSSNANNNKYLISGTNAGSGGGGISLIIANQNNTNSGISVWNQGTGYGINISSEKGTSGNFQNLNTTNTLPALSASTAGTGPGLSISNYNANAVSSLATFKKNGLNVARIDGTGKGFFNGGTQNSGADLAEAFDVTGNRNEYEAGDVLIISQDRDRAVEKSNGAYSTLVAGVYATKPGILLTEEDIETDISDKVPMGVVGVIPTKVCPESGEIKRGDLLVTSSIPGVAMKADTDKVKPGQIIGKALENFSSDGIGKIKVLVNVK